MEFKDANGITWDYYFVVERHAPDGKGGMIDERWLEDGELAGTYQNADKFDTKEEAVTQLASHGNTLCRVLRVIPEQNGYPGKWRVVHSNVARSK